MDNFLHTHLAFAFYLLSEVAYELIQVARTHQLIIHFGEPVPAANCIQPALNHVKIDSNYLRQLSSQHSSSLFDGLCNRRVECLLCDILVAVGCLIEDQSETWELQEEFNEGPLTEGVRFGLLKTHELGHERLEVHLHIKIIQLI